MFTFGLACFLYLDRVRPRSTWGAADGEDRNGFLDGEEVPLG